MDPVEYLRGIKRRWRLVAACVVLSLIGAWGLTSVVGSGGGKSTVTATVTLVQSSSGGAAGEGRGNGGSSTTGTSNTTTIAALVTVDQVTQAVAKEMKFVGDPKLLAKKVTATVELKTGFLKISAKGATAQRARQLADSFARQLLVFLVQREKLSNDALIKSLDGQIARIRQDIAALDKQIAKYPAAIVPTTKGGSAARGGTSGSASKTAPNTGTPADPLIAQRNAALDHVASLSNQLQDAKSRTADAEGLAIIQTAKLDKKGAGLSIPRSLSARLLIAAILGLLGGIALALVRERFDRRIRTRETAERHFGFPVLAEVPIVRKRGFLGRRRNGTLASLSQLPPAAIDAYRLLASGLNGTAERNGSTPIADRRTKPKAILVTSAGPDDGKTSIVAYLASTLAAAGKTVTVVSCDFRHPEIHREFGLTDQRSLADVLLSSNGGPVLSSCLWQTPITGVWIVPSGAARESDQLLSSPALRRLLMEARQLSDVVLVLTAPILTSDATYLLPEVDGVLVAVRAGTTKPELAERSSEFLKRLKAPVMGMVLTGHTEAALPHGYYRTWSVRKAIVGSPRVIARGLRRSPRAVAKVFRAARFRGRGFPRLTRRAETK
jgi:Mrp family chromosome partitioning ATPase/capsular polysaccharide biosynthesis protein